MNTNNRTGIILRCFVIVIAVLSIFALMAGGLLATPFFYGEGVAPLKWPIGTAANPTVIKIYIEEDSHKPPDRSELLKEGMERWNAELQNRGIKLEVTVGIPDPMPAGGVPCTYGNAGDSLPMDQGDPNAPTLNGNKGLAGCTGPEGGSITSAEILIMDNLPAAGDDQKEQIRNLGAHEVTHILGLDDDTDGNVTDHLQGSEATGFSAHDRAEISTLYPDLGSPDSQASGTQQSAIAHQYDWEFVYEGPEDGHVTLITLGIDPNVIADVIAPPGWIAFNPADPDHLLPEYPYYQDCMIDGHPVPAPWDPDGDPAVAYRAQSGAAALSVTHPVEMFTLIALNDIPGQIPVWAGGDIQWLEGPVPESPVPEPPVGGTIVPSDKLGLITPWLTGALLVSVTGISLALWSRKRKATTTDR